MAPTKFDIFDINDAFAVSIPSCTDFEVDEAPANRASSSPEVVMPQFFCTDNSDISSSDSDVVFPEVAAPAHAPLLRTDGRQAVNPWDPRLVGDLALGIDSTEEVIDRYGLSKDEFERLCEVPAFRRELSVAVRDLRENGTAYSERCKAMSATYLERVDQLIYDNATPASTVLAAAQWVAKMGRLEPREDKNAGNDSGGNTVNLVINFANVH